MCYTTSVSVFSKQAHPGAPTIRGGCAEPGSNVLGQDQKVLGRFRRITATTPIARPESCAYVLNVNIRRTCFGGIHDEAQRMFRKSRCKG